MKKQESILIRLLVVITIIAIPAAMWLPALAGAANGTIQAEQTPKSKTFEDSPFGYLWPGTEGDTWQEKYGDAVNIGIRWNRGGGQVAVITWSQVQKDQDAVDKGLFDWSHYDHELLLVTQAGLHIVVNFDSEGRRSPDSVHGLKEGSWLPINEDAYYRFVRAVVERYDGDGVDDAPGGIRVKHWQVDNEPNFEPQRSAESYAEFLKKMYAAIKQSEPEAKVLMAGCGGQGWELEGFARRGETVPTLGYYERILSALKGENCFDIFDWHFYGNATGDYRRLGKVVPVLRQTLDKHGYKNAPIWITETCTYSGMLNDDPTTFQNEEAQAGDLIKRYVYSLALGVKKIFWCVRMMEGGPSGYFSQSSLIFNGEGDFDRGHGVRKLAYYTYKLMTEKLEGKQFAGEVIGLPANVSGYRFQPQTRNSKPVTVIWWDWWNEPNENTKEVMLPADGKLVLTSAITDSKGNRNVSMADAKDGKIKVTLSQAPLFVEPIRISDTARPSNGSG